MQGYERSSYGDAFADVYDDWYGDVSDVARTVDVLAALAAEHPGLAVVELGVGTGRLARPLAQAVPATVTVVGLDTSEAMLERLRVHEAAAPSARPVQAVRGDMIDDLPPGPLGVVFVAFNTLFNLGERERQIACFAAVAERLAPGGVFVVEAAVPDDDARSGGSIEVRSMTVDRVVLSVSRYDRRSGVAEGQFVELTEAGGVRLRPWSVRYATPDELDTMAAAAGLVLRDRWETFAGEPFTAASGRHVSIFTSP